MKILPLYLLYAIGLSVGCRKKVFALGSRRSCGPNVGSFLRTAKISRADVANFMLNQLTSDGYLGAAPGLYW
jgi:hypothetical protein